MLEFGLVTESERVKQVKCQLMTSFLLPLFYCHGDNKGLRPHLPVGEVSLLQLEWKYDFGEISTHLKSYKNRSNITFSGRFAYSGRSAHLEEGHFSPSPGEGREAHSSPEAKEPRGNRPAAGWGSLSQGLASDERPREEGPRIFPDFPPSAEEAGHCASAAAVHGTALLEETTATSVGVGRRRALPEAYMSICSWPGTPMWVESRLVLQVSILGVREHPPPPAQIPLAFCSLQWGQLSHFSFLFDVFSLFSIFPFS